MLLVHPKFLVRPSKDFQDTRNASRPPERTPNFSEHY